VVDGGRRARMGLELAKDNLNLSFSGELTHETIEKVFASFPMKGSSLRGDIVLSAALTKPITVSARGRLDGSNVAIPVGAQKRAVFERFRIEASGQAVQVRSADLLWGKSRLALSGAVTGTEDLLRVDMDVAGDQLDWEELQNYFGAASKQGMKDSGRMVSVPNVEGIVRLKTERFMIDRFNVSPLEATVAISPSGIRTQLARGVVCGIDAKGRIDIIETNIALDLALSAMDAQLEPTTICLTNQQSDIKGTYSLTARVEGRGDRDRLRSVLKGSFELNARDGEFVRAAGLDAAFDYLNGTGDFAVNFPDLNKQSFPYRLLAAKGKLDGERVFIDEVVIEASPLTVTSQGSVDFQGQHIDLKGLVSVALPAHQVIKRIPIVGAIVGGSLVGIPVRVNGPLARPKVTYLSPADVGMELLSVPMRILGAPLEAIKLFAPSGDGRD
ncbi:MAG TPA: AsmA-like C-terminal region-containing protein, partial [Candidatus Limnocylindria bacterium]|nr:AsmA-like C-terminal region-containing protein [Candidatus Limnocylindria bacterium]